MNDSIDDTLSKLAAEKESRLKEIELKSRRINQQYDQMKESEREMELAKQASFGPLSSEKAAKLAQESTEYIEAASGVLPFVDPETFNGIVPLFPNNLILLGALSGHGKSTCVANVVRQLQRQKDRETGKPKKVLVITNEESAVDFYNRVTCLIKGWYYVNHDQFSEEQKQTFALYIPLLNQIGLTVVDDNYEIQPGVPIGGLTSSVEGIELIFANLLRDKIYYDCVILDYYQGVNESKLNPTMKDWEVQGKLVQILEKYRKKYPAPIVVMAQVNPPEGDKPSPFQVRIQGRKSICTKATMIMEIIRDEENHRTEWLIHKSRFGQAVGKSLYTGYEKGRYVHYSEEFKRKVASLKDAEQHKNALKGVFKEKDGKE